MKIINIQNNQGTPKYKQIISSIEKSIEKGHLKRTKNFPQSTKYAWSFPYPATPFYKPMKN
jgi:DNA-binding transcriptional regulator YhcF (GntR family)